ncbi:Sugar phosphate permease [Octadecabacter temperatus]|uniref:Putative sulfoacetate transporter SauU n=1 Tax=Octadecabacter temperatus TaxID=1458307 RepID=A0A0K0Y186_9RHOB|nr:MFS transporter [Octadecabacter temperatus]AKS44667.1 putative sulfoacetate transporter SauU [Octadecabacter temperatus]SIO36757.1 Sugar phosphate permease [Octadecabacter temperatus]
MRLGLIFLVLGYVMSQFYRAFLAVLTPALEADLGATSSDLAFASGLWFFVFAAMQIPVGSALDRFGPRITVAVLFAVGGAGGAFVFGIAQTPTHIAFAMALIGIGCSPVLMAGYYIFAKVYPPAVFATLAGAFIGIGSLGNLASSAPMAWAVEAFGWRESMIFLAVVSLIVAVVLWFMVKDPPKSDGTAAKGSVLDVLKIRALWFIIPLTFVCYAPAAGLRGLWIGPYGAEVFGADTSLIGTMTLVMALAMIVGNFAYGPLDRILGTRKWVIFWGNALGAAGCLVLAFLPDTSGVWTATILLGLVGLFGSSYPMIMAHARPFFPSHLTGRGVTLMNLFSIGGAGIMQFVTGRIMASLQLDPSTAPVAYQLLFAFYGLLICCGLAIYVFSTDRTD